MDREVRRRLIIEAACAEGYKDRISWALHALEAGANSESLCVLASLTLEKLPNPWEAEALFRRSLKELEWPLLQYEDEELLRQRARDLCENFLSDHLSPRRLTHELGRMAADLNHPTDLSVWAELDDYWPLIGVYHRDEAELKEDIRQEAHDFIASTPKRYY